MSDTKDQAAVQTTPAELDPNPGSDPQSKQDREVAVTADQSQEIPEYEGTADQIEATKQSRWAYFQTKEFYITLLLGLVVAFPYVTRYWC